MLADFEQMLRYPIETTGILGEGAGWALEVRFPIVPFREFSVSLDNEGKRPPR